MKSPLSYPSPPKKTQLRIMNESCLPSSRLHMHLLLFINNIKNKSFQCFPGSSAGKESAWSAGDPGSIPGLGRCPGKGIGYPLQYSWASLVAQTVKNPPACRRPEFNPWVRMIPREGNVPTPVLLPGELNGQRSLEDYRPWGHKQTDKTEWLSLLFTWRAALN